jgi:hypothetical protein
MKRVIEMLKDRVETLDKLIRDDDEYVTYLRDLERHGEADRVIDQREERKSFQEEVKDAIEKLEDAT